ncbi:flagellar basal body rod protein FlgB [Oceanobacillus halophilus]|uniref:Flagellar basal body rod protein FlgB n=1 Tax=Oceanobacillus halophilus TaxID=930130 RepID=A0A495ABY2_9BACI|nr:flagellar basal body rod protein FlgB [Oceanobacillus halophilus]RKQ37478.1 flagellar basal body rod protein FlgB [Oceanobacillus halophilus]
MVLFGGTIHTLQNSLDYAATKNRVISDNVANVDTPNYKAKGVSFKNVLSNAMDSTVQAQKTHSKHISFNETDSSVLRVTSNQQTAYNHNGNNVDIDKEMADLAKNQIYYNSLVERMNGKFGSLQTVIRGGN